MKLDDWSEAQIRFWKRVYTEVDSEKALIHDSVNLAHVYQTVSSTPAKIEAAKKEVHDSLMKIYNLNAGRASIDSSRLSLGEQVLFEILDANEDPRAYQFAADMDRIRAQIGQRDRLENAFSISKRYLPRMEEMFIEEGVPPELTRLPFVESGFVSQARSKVGATGIWQFMPQTAAKDLRVTASIDERYDPLKSTRAAAKFLMSNYKILKSWPLAVMAYHHGAGLVLKAMKALKTDDPITVIRTFKDSNFQFASRNYLFEFLAMLDVNASKELFFKDVPEAMALPEFITVSFPRKTDMKTILSHYKLSESLTRVLNPHFLEPIWLGRAKIPAHYPIRITGITLEEFRKNEYPKTQ
ncbi:MAG: lytic transglycosylase domain-containing protein [Bdellovibrionales bacterium]|nr:lytic transglycosylase domain-containing protein [Bdellovibrionales bacterium]